jgi:hypothetical protein
VSSNIFILGTIPELSPSISFIGAPVSRRFVKLTPIPPPFFDNTAAELSVRIMLSMLSCMSSKKQLVNPPLAVLPEFWNVGVAGWNCPLRMDFAMFDALQNIRVTRMDFYTDKKDEIKTNR